MKNKYQRMTKEEKKKVRNRYYKTEKGRNQKNRLIRLFICGVLGTLFAIYMIIDGYLKGTINIWIWIVSIILLLFSITFIVSSIYLRGKCLNLYAVKNGHI